MITIAENYETKNKEVEQLKLSKLAKFVLKNEDAPASSSASLNFVSVDTIHNLNLQYRGIDSPTDVLSFECDGVSDEFAENPNNEFIFGDVFICIEIAAKNAKKYNSDLASELCLLTVHGMLHLSGYDHIIEKEAEIMEAREDELLDLWEKQSCTN